MKVYSKSFYSVQICHGTVKSCHVFGEDGCDAFFVFCDFFISEEIMCDIIVTKLKRNAEPNASKENHSLIKA